MAKILTLLLCDTAIREEGSGKLSLIGLFSAVPVPTFPSTISQVALYVRFVGVEHEIDIAIRLTGPETLAEEAREILEATGNTTRVASPGDPAIGDFALTLRQVPLPVAGAYTFRVTVGDAEETASFVVTEADAQ